MSYLHIPNLYKDQTILMFKECYALEKIHGSSAHVRWNSKDKTINFFAGGESHTNFVKIFDVEFLKQKISEIFVTSNVCVYGEVYGGSCQKMSLSYGKDMKFIGFDVKVNDVWLSVPNAHDVCNKLNIEFVDYVKVSTDLESLNRERDKDSTQAIRNGCGEGKLREGVVLKPLIELTTNNGERIISKHKRDEFMETKTPREVNPEDFKILTEAREIADEWVTENRMDHILQKLPQDINVQDTLVVIKAMLEDVYREAKGEIVESKEVSRAIMNKTSKMFIDRIKSNLK